MKRLGVFLIFHPLDGMLVYHMFTLSIKFAVAHIYFKMERGTVGGKCFAQEHNTLSPARARNRTTQSGVERTSHEGSAPPGEVIMNQAGRNMTRVEE